ncbi:hypothetical protein ABIF42_002501 [Bradyrhizobium diazoefficiens]
MKSSPSSHGTEIQFEKSYTRPWVFGEEEAGGKTGLETVHSSSLVQPAGHG